MCENKIVKKVSFTGSTPVAKLLYKMAAGTLKKFVFLKFLFFFPRCLNLCVECLWKLVAMLLSLFSPTPILTKLSTVRARDPTWLQILDLLLYAAAIVCKFRGSGQTCVCANRIYVHSSIYAEFASRLADRVAKFKVGNGLEEGT
jgi:succinate-semialdehyde dehydrogenase / glutarate-semialdehyde dehydrogenase